MNDSAVLLVGAITMLTLAIAAIVLAVAVGLGAATLTGITFTGAS